MLLQNDRIIINLPGATTEVATLKQALSEAENKAAQERTDGKNKRLMWARCSKSSRLS